MTGTDLTILVALAAGVISFLSPCVLPLVPAYLGQLTRDRRRRRGAGRPHRRAGSRCATRSPTSPGSVPSSRSSASRRRSPPVRSSTTCRPLRIIGGVVLIVLGLEPGRHPRIPALERTWRPLDAGRRRPRWRPRPARWRSAAAGDPAVGDRLGGRTSVSSSGGWLASFGLGAIFAIGWTPCIGIILGGILTLAATSAPSLQGTVLLVAYTLGLGLPFLLIAAVYDRAPRLMPPLVRHGRAVSLIGGLLVAFIGVAMLFDWLALLPRYFSFNTAI